eukprot:330475-Chlamydomonas_euryale.AAC.1
MTTLVVSGAVGAKLDALKEAQDRLAQKQDKLAQKIEEERNSLSNKMHKMDRKFATRIVWLAVVVAAWAVTFGLLVVPEEAFRNFVLGALLGKGPLLRSGEVCVGMARAVDTCVCVKLQLWTAQPPLAEWIRR